MTFLHKMMLLEGGKVHHLQIQGDDSQSALLGYSVHNILLLLATSEQKKYLQDYAYPCCIISVSEMEHPRFLSSIPTLHHPMDPKGGGANTGNDDPKSIEHEELEASHSDVIVIVQCTKNTVIAVLPEGHPDTTKWREVFEREAFDWHDHTHSQNPNPRTRVLDSNHPKTTHFAGGGVLFLDPHSSTIKVKSQSIKLPHKRRSPSMLQSLLKMPRQ